MKKPIYFDYASTTPIDYNIVKKMIKCMNFYGDFGNTINTYHFYGLKAAELVDISRNKIADLIGANSHEIIFTSGATESNNLAIKGIANFYKNKGNHIITSQIEHPSVIDTCKELSLNKFDITYIKPKYNGIISLSEIKNKIKKNTILISIIHVNNEIGTIQDIKKIGEICEKNNIFFHVDASQSICKLLINVKKLKIDLMSISAHKIYGPKGIGALYINDDKKIQLYPQIHGGGHEKGFRSGTLAVHQIVGMGESCSISKKKIIIENNRLYKIRNLFLKEIKNIKDININNEFKDTIPNIINISFKNILKDDLILKLKNIAFSSGSACSYIKNNPSYVLLAIGLNKFLASNSIRISFGKFTKIKHIKYATELLKKSIKKLQLKLKK